MLRSISLSIACLCISFVATAQKYGPGPQTTYTDTPKEAYTIDVTQTTCANPTLGYERFYHNSKGKLRSWQIQAGYQFLLTKEFNFAGFWGMSDIFGPGIYHGLTLHGLYDFYNLRAKRDKPRYKYIALGLHLKYLWYNDVHVYDQMKYSASSQYNYARNIYKIQSERCLAIIPQLIWGRKKTIGHFVADWYVGVEAVIKCRFKTISYEQTDSPYGPIIINTSTPYNDFQCLVITWFTIGLKMGYMR